MRAGERLALAIVLGVAVLAAGAAGAATYAWHAGGTVRVAVHAAGPDGTDVNVQMPGVLLNAAIALCPTPQVLDDPQARAALAAVGSAADQLATMPDAVLVDVREEGSRVRETRDWVDIDVPIRSVRFLAEKLGRAARVPAAV